MKDHVPNFVISHVQEVQVVFQLIYQLLHVLPLQEEAYDEECDTEAEK